MSTWTGTLECLTQGRGFYDLTSDLARSVESSGIDSGLCHVFIQHTSASLIINENADQDVRVDLETFMADLVPDGDSRFLHQAEGPDDMPAHIRSVLTATELTLPVRDGCLILGTWQNVYLWEHRTHQHKRRVLVTVQGSS